MTRSISITLALVFSTLSTDAFAKDGVSVVFKNKSSLTITNLYLSPAKEAHWGADQLGDGESDTISPNEEFTLSEIKPNIYYIKLVDEDEDDSVVSGVKIRENEAVALTDELLVGCQVASAAAEIESDDEAEG